MNIILIPLTAIASVLCNKQERSPVASAAESSAKPYPLDTCLVSGKQIGSMGDPVIIIHEGHEIQFCCDSCVTKFRKDAAKYLAKLDQANHRQ